MSKNSSGVFIQQGDSVLLELSSTNTAVSATLPGTGDVMRLIYNTGSAVPVRAFLKAGTGPQTATAADFPVVNGESALLFVGDAADTISGIAPFVAGQVVATRGIIS